ncbi:MAG: alanine:cation symporter family protein [Spirochaetaceae bacterium]|jgi:AGCS family alanine or glycine:cation symporter|nr:alanine:cation symporter family protein [Spirochaetaceae bacterium]
MDFFTRIVNEISEIILKPIDFVNNILWSYVMIIMLIALGLFFSIRTKFVQFRYFFEMFKLMSESTSAESEGNGKHKKKISSFQAFCISAASRVGTGNLAGVAIAITSGGPGAVFWMWVIAFIGGATSFIESTLAQIYKVQDGGNFRGGPAYYMEKALKQRWMGVIFVFLIMFTFGFAFNATQANTIAGACQKAFGIKPVYIGLVLSVITGLVIFGGLKRIADISSMIVPVMAILYMACALFVVIINIKYIPVVFTMIFESAFGIKQFLGGTFGSAILFGIKRGLFSNEAGMGSVPNAAAAAHTSHPAKQGFIQTLGVFFDTMLICSATAFILLVYIAQTNTEELSVTGIQFTQIALEYSIPGAQIFVAVCIFLFAWSSVIGNYFYGETNLSFLSSRKVYLSIFRVLVIVFIMAGSVASLNMVWAFADFTMALMAIINLIAITAISPVAVKSLKDYEKQKKSGKPPVFTKNSIPEITSDIECWN